MKNKISLVVIVFSILAMIIGSPYLFNSNNDTDLDDKNSTSKIWGTIADKEESRSAELQNSIGETAKLQIKDVFSSVNKKYKNLNQKKIKVEQISLLVSQHVSGIQQNLIKLIDDPDNSLAKQLIEGEVIELSNLHSNSLDILSANKTEMSKLTLVSERFNGLIELLDSVSNAPPEEIVSRAEEALAWTDKHRRQIAPMADDQPTFTTKFNPIRSEEDIVEGTAPIYVTQLENNTASVLIPSKINSEKSFSIFKSAYAATLQTPEISAASCSYNAADLAQSLPEVVFSDEVKSLAESLDYSPVRIYEYLKNEIQYDPYYGSIKGASMTLKSASGNATDHASLFIALLRYSGFPARYVKGEIYFANDDSRGAEWMGAKTAVAGRNIYQKGHGVSKVSSGRLFIQDHVWVEACIPYDNYRSTDSDKTGYSWLPLDVSFKEMDFVQGTLVPNGFQFDFDAFLSERHIQKPVDILIKQVEVAIGTAVDGFGYQGTIKQREIDILPSTLPYIVNRYISWEDSTSSETITLPSNHKYKITAKLKNASGNPLYSSSGNLLLVDLLDNPFTLSSTTIGSNPSVKSWMAVPCTTNTNSLQATVCENTGGKRLFLPTENAGDIFTTNEGITATYLLTAQNSVKLTDGSNYGLGAYYCSVQSGSRVSNQAGSSNWATILGTKYSQFVKCSYITNRYPESTLFQVNKNEKMVPIPAGGSSRWTSWVNGDSDGSQICGVALKPELFVDGQRVAMGTLNQNNLAPTITGRSITSRALSSPPSSYTTRTITVPNACNTNYTLNILPTLNGNAVIPNASGVEWNNIETINDHVIQVYGYHSTDKYIDTKINQLLGSISGSTTDYDITQKEKLETFLDIVGLKYMNNYSQDSKTIGQLYGGNGLSGLHVGLVSSRMQVNYLFDLPLGISGAGFLVDVPGGVGLSTDITTGGFNLESFVVSGFSASAEESYIWQELAYLDAVSTVRGIQFANEQYASDSTKSVFRLETSADVTANLNVNCPADLKYSAQEISDFQSILSGEAENYMRIPECKIMYDNWRGSTYFAFTKSGSSYGARYAIGGDYVDGANGGYTTGQSFSSQNLSTISSAITPSSFGFVGGSTSLANTISVPPSSITPDFQSNWAPDQFLLTGGNTGTSSFSSFAGDPVNLLSGNMYHQETDIDISGRGGLNLTFERHYNSHNRKDGPLGIGWTHNFNQSLIFNDDDADANSSEGVDSDGKTSSIVWKDSSGALIVFENVAVNSSGIVNSNQTFSVIEGKHITAKRLSNGVYEIKLKGGLRLQFQSINGTAGQSARLSKIIDRNNNQLIISYDSSGRIKDISDQLNRKLTFNYIGSSKHIALISDWTGRLFSYEYDSNNHLVRYKNPLASKGEIPPVIYEYFQESDGVELAHAMKSITDAGGSAMNWQYYLNGKVFRTINAEGNTFTFTYNLLRRETETVNEKGQKEIALFNEYGRMIKKTYADGAFEEWKYAAANPNLQTEYRGTDGLKIKYQYDSNEDLTKTIFPSGNFVQNFNFNSYGKATKLRAANGNYLLKRYYSNGELKEELILNKGVSTTSPSPAQISSWVKYVYNQYGDLTTTTKITDFITQTGPYSENLYSANGLKVVKVKLCGKDRNNDGVLDGCDENNFQYDSLGRVVVSQIKGVNKTLSFSETNKIIKKETNLISNPSLKIIEENEYNETGLLLRTVQTERTDNEIRVVYQATLIYDELNRLSESRNGSNAGLIYHYDEIGNIKSIVNEKNESIQYKYDSRNRAVSVTDEEGKQIQKRVYGVNGQLKRTVNQNDETVQYIYYGAQGDGRLKEKRYQNGITESWVYDAEGNTLSAALDSTVNSGASYNTNVEYDVQNRATLILGPVHKSILAGQNTNVRVAIETKFDKFGSISEKLVGYALPGQQKQAMKAVIKDRFDAGGLLLSSEDQLGNKTNYFYDESDNLTKTINRDSTYTTSAYSVNNNLDKVSIFNDSNSLLMDTIYIRSLFNDEVDSVTQNNYQPPQFLSSNERASIKNTIDYTSDLNGLTVGVEQKVGEHSQSLSLQVLQPYKYQYDAEDRLIQTTDLNNNNNQYTYDLNGSLSSIKLSNGVHINFIYDNKNRLVERKFSTGFGTRYKFDSDDYLESISNYKTGGIEVSKHSYTFDWAGRKLTSRNTTRGVSTAKTFLTTYTYDRKNRLLSENIYKKNGWDQSVNISDNLRHRIYNFNYDINDNMYAKTVQCFSNTGINRGQVDYSYTYNVGEQLTLLKHKGVNIPSTGDDCEGYRNHDWQNITYTYDENGSVKLEQRGGSNLIYGYDPLNRLHSASGTNIKNEPVDETYEYDYLGRRVRKTAGNKELIYFYQGDQITASFEKNKGEAIAVQPIPDLQYIYAGLDTPIASIDKTGNIVYFYQDDFNSVTVSVNGNGVVSGANIYTAWGEGVIEEGDTGIFAYTGREKDDSLLLYYRNRYYNPSKARFTQQDPVGYKDALNLYSYVGNAPTLYTDPFGLSISSSSAIQNSLTTQDFGYTNTVSDFNLSLSSPVDNLVSTTNSTVAGRVSSIIGEFGNTAGAFVDVLGKTNVGAVFEPALLIGAVETLVAGKALVNALIKNATAIETKITVDILKNNSIKILKKIYKENKLDVAVIALTTSISFSEPLKRVSVVSRRGGGPAEKVSDSKDRVSLNETKSEGPKDPGKSIPKRNKRTFRGKDNSGKKLIRFGNDILKEILGSK